MKVKQIPNYPDYLISENGDVFSKKYGKIRKRATAKQRNGYRKLTLGVNGKGHYKWVHRLVLTAFDRMPRPHEECRHLDGDRENNHISNLKWGTHTENCNDTWNIHKTGNPSRGEKSGNCKLSNKQVQEIRDLYETSNYSQTKLGEIYNVSARHICDIVNNKQRVLEVA